MTKKSINKDRLGELIYEGLETELGGVQVYETALECVQNEDLREEWQKYLEETREHVEVMEELCDAFGLDPSQETPGRMVVRSIAESLVAAMEMAKKSGDPAAAEIVAGECVVHAETKDHMNWHLLKECAKNLTGEEREALETAIEEVEDQEDEHVYHSKGWTRELWLESLGVGGVLPPPEERRDVKTAIGAARAEKERKTMKPAKSSK